VSKTPFPQFKEQTEGAVPEQKYPAAGPEHPMAHPTPSLELSSQSSAPSTRPFEQKLQIERNPLQIQPASV